jgi:hypothetical protein
VKYQGKFVLKRLRRASDITDPNFRRQQGMPDHICHHEAKIASLGTTVRDHHNVIQAMQQEITMMRNSFIRLDEHTIQLTSAVTELKEVMKEMSKINHQWQGALKIITFLVGTMMISLISLYVERFF